MPQGDVQELIPAVKKSRDARPCRKAGFFIFLTRAAVFCSILPAATIGADDLQHKDSLTVHRRSSSRHILPDCAYFKGYFVDMRNIVCAPVKWQWRQWLATSLAAGCGAGLYLHDREIRTAVQERRTRGADNAAAVARFFGAGEYVIPLLGATYAGGYIFTNARAERIALAGLESVAVSRLFTEALKFSCHRRRPCASSSPDVWDGPGFSTHDLSFPSGHATVAAALATVMAMEYRETPAVGAIAYAVAAATAWSRVNDDKHWASDVFAGLMIGCCCTRVIVVSRRDRGWNVSARPQIAGRGAGLLLTAAY